jgi:hypothetical protein
MPKDALVVKWIVRLMRGNYECKVKTGNGLVGYKFKTDLLCFRLAIGTNKIKWDASEMDEILEIQFNNASDIDSLIKNLEKLSLKMKESEQLAICA